MDKDEMKNRISMALKDPILQQGFEIICKENEELREEIQNLEGIKLAQETALGKEYMIEEQLQKENEELKKDYEETEELLDKQIEETYKLFEENAKLKKHCANYEMQISKMEKGACDVCKETEKDEQLIKAKELLKFWVNDFYDNSFNPIKYEKRNKALEESEQFLKL